MAGQANPISPPELYDRIGIAAAPLVIGVRRAQAFDADADDVGALGRLPDAVADWRLAISQRLSANFTDDLDMLAQGMVVCSALYGWCGRQAAEGS